MQWQACASTGQVVSKLASKRRSYDVTRRWCLSDRSTSAISGPASTRMFGMQLFHQVLLALLREIALATGETAHPIKLTGEFECRLAVARRRRQMFAEQLRDDMRLGHPVVMAASVDPVGRGLVQSLAHPGGNISGMRLQSTETMGKRLELLKELVPGVAPVGVLWYRAEPADWQAAQAAARARGWKLLSLEVRDIDEIAAALKAAMGAGAGALLVLGGGVFFAHARRIAELAASQRLPSMFALRPLVEAGGLMSHGADLNDIWHRAATYIDKILKGAKPGDLRSSRPPSSSW